MISTLTFDPIWFGVLSDWFVNLSAGWFGAALIVPVAGKEDPVNWPIALSNIGLALVFLVFAYILQGEVPL